VHNFCISLKSLKSLEVSSQFPFSDHSCGAITLQIS